MATRPSPRETASSSMSCPVRAGARPPTSCASADPSSSRNAAGLRARSSRGPSVARTSPIMIETTRKLSALSEEFVEVAFRHEPTAATQAGIHDYDHELPDHSREGFQRRLVWLQDFNSRLTAGVRAEDLPPAPRTHHALLRSYVWSMLDSPEQRQDPRREPVPSSQSALNALLLVPPRPF